MMRTLLIVGLACLAGACASTDLDKNAAKDKDPPPLTPTEKFAITVTPRPDQILLAPHAQGLSPAQSQALADLVSRWRESGQTEITIQSPSGGGEAAYRSATYVQQALLDLGLAPGQIRLVSYEAAASAAPIMVGFQSYDAQGPQCGHDWSSFTRTKNNDVNGEFGCAVTANIAAMIANPGDLIQPRAQTDIDASRREVVLGKYRTGDATSSTKDTQASGAVSDVGQ